MKKIDQEIEIIHNGNLTYEQQLERIKEINNIFVDIAVKYHVENINNKSETGTK